MDMGINQPSHSAYMQRFTFRTVAVPDTLFDKKVLLITTTHQVTLLAQSDTAQCIDKATLTNTTKKLTTSVEEDPEFPLCEVLMCSSRRLMEKPICPQQEHVYERVCSVDELSPPQYISETRQCKSPDHYLALVTQRILFNIQSENAHTLQIINTRKSLKI